MKRIVFWVIFLAFSLAVLVVWTGYWYSNQPLGVLRGAVEFTVPRGTTMRQAAGLISRAGVGVDARLLSFLAQATNRAKQIKAGSYQVKSGITPWDLILKLEAGEVVQGRVLLVEGWTFRQMRATLESHPDLIHDTAGLSDAEILSRIGASQKRPEGLFFPDTYMFDKQSSALAVFSRAYQAMQVRLDTEWASRARDLPLKSPYEALILASIVEKETGRREDRTRIANVFVNRLRVKMRLQTDPTVIYGLGSKYRGTLYSSDLTTDTPWNTYTRAGLPPTPIALPGRGALHAALHPEGGDMLYFVARGDGSSEFSRTLDEHNKAVARYLRKQGTSGN